MAQQGQHVNYASPLFSGAIDHVPSQQRRNNAQLVRLLTRLQKLKGLTLQIAAATDQCLEEHAILPEYIEIVKFAGRRFKAHCEGLQSLLVHTQCVSQENFGANRRTEVSDTWQKIQSIVAGTDATHEALIHQFESIAEFGADNGVTRLSLILRQLIPQYSNIRASLLILYTEDITAVHVEHANGLLGEDAMYHLRHSAYLADFPDDASRLM